MSKTSKKSKSPYIKRDKVRLTYALIGIGCALTAVAYLLKSDLITILGTSTMLVGITCCFIYLRCPHCGKFQKEITPFEETAGPCKKCKREMQFDK